MDIIFDVNFRHSTIEFNDTNNGIKFTKKAEIDKDYSPLTFLKQTISEYEKLLEIQKIRQKQETK